MSSEQERLNQWFASNPCPPSSPTAREIRAQKLQRDLGIEIEGLKLHSLDIDLAMRETMLDMRLSHLKNLTMPDAMK